MYTPFLLVGLLRWRRVEPWGLVAHEDPAATKMLAPLDKVIEDITTHVQEQPNLQKYVDILEQCREELLGNGQNPDLLSDINLLAK